MSYKRMTKKYNISDKDWELIARSIYDKNEDTEAENLSASATEFVGDEMEMKKLTNLTERVDLYFELNQYNADSAWEKVENRIQNQREKESRKIRPFYSLPLFRMAAAVLVATAVLFAGLRWARNISEQSKMLEISSTDQVLKTFTLPDGTVVSLNSDTKIKYPQRFGRNTREVSIEGEAFFEVKPNKHKPFIIHAGNAEIKVLGTSFNVNAYPQTKQVEVIVETGKVQVVNKNTQTNELILDPGDKGTLIYSSNSLLKTTNQDPNFLAWKTHNLIFKATSLGEVIQTLEKVYKVNIHLADQRLGSLLLSAQFNDDSLDFIMKVIGTTFQIEPQQIDGQYFLKAKS